ncbi:MAG: hypothetical protein LBL69_04500 [Zoogloeaceae bacterium]|jgi:hypothetical protein|nr:hypothetical protein [Zoogloeaceae bacterium]
MPPNLDRNANRYVYSKGRETGFEHLYVYDEKTGKVYRQETDHDPARVMPSQKTKALLESKDVALALVHNHPSSLSLSRADLGMVLSKPGGKRVVAVGADGSVFAAEKGPAIHRLGKAVDVATEEVVHQTLLAKERGLILEGWQAHLVNLALDAEGIIHYQATLAESRARFYSEERKAMDAIVEAARRRIQEVMK